jgi:hypothetical protein
LNYPNDLPASGTSKDGTDDVDLPTKTIKQDPEAAEAAALILHKKQRSMSKVNPNPEPEF